MAIEVRGAVPADLPAIEALERACFSMPWPREALENQLQSGHVFLAAETDGALAGYMGFQYVLDEGYISNVCTAPEYRRRGVAAALLTEARRRAGVLELAFLTLEVRAGNAPARALYARFGYEVAGRRKNYYEKPAEDAIIMTLFLK